MAEPYIRNIRDRHQMIRFFDGYAIERMEELDKRKLKRPLVKTHLIELLNGKRSCTPPELIETFGKNRMRLEPLDHQLFFAEDAQIGEIGFLEHLRPRVVALYSTMKSDELNRYTRRLVMRSPEIDHVWLSGLTFGVLCDLVAKLSRPHRFTKLVFTHDSIFDIDSSRSELELEEEETAQSEDLEEVVEKRATSFRLVDQVGVIQEKLGKLQELYFPLYAISQLRFPSPVGRGGHDFYDNGRVTNRSQSFRDHRSHILFVVRIYEQLLKSTEEQAWYSIRESVSTPGQFCRIVGAPVIVRFREELSRDVFDRWVLSTFGRKRNRFRLWGHPIRLGPAKVHVYGVDRHLWQPLFLELTAKGCTMIIPNGTCGNTVHRLVTNIQRYLDPGAEAFIGEKHYKQIVEESVKGIPYELDSR
jgi:hypothetical protein